MKTRYFIAGMNHRGTEALVRALDSGSLMELRREPDNPHDKNAVQIWSGDTMVGYVRGYQAKNLAPAMDAMPNADAGGAGGAGSAILVGALAFTENSKVPVVEIEDDALA